MATLVYNRTTVDRLQHSQQDAAKLIADHLAQTTAPRLQQIVQSTHPWQTRTGKLEQSIEGYAAVDPSLTSVTVGVGYNATAVSDSGYPYGSRLEHDYAGQYQILRPTIMQEAAAIITEAKAALKGGG